MGQIYGFLVRSHQKIAYSDLPAQLILGEPLKKWLAERDSKLVISERFEEEMENTTETVKKYLNLNMTIDEMMVNLDVDYERLLSLLNPDNRFVLQINDEWYIYYDKIIIIIMIEKKVLHDFDIEDSDEDETPDLLAKVCSNVKVEERLKNGFESNFLKGNLLNSMDEDDDYTYVIIPCESTLNDKPS